MKKRIANYISFLLMCFSFITLVFAKVDVVDNGYMIQRLASVSSPKITSVTSKDDLVTVKASGTIVGYYYGTAPNVNTASFTKTSSGTFYAAVKNGVYYFWVAGTGVSSGNVNAVMYPNGVRVSTSCTNQSVKNCSGSGTIERCYVYTGGKSVSPEKTGDLVTPASGYKLNSLKVSSNNCSNLSLSVGGQTLPKRYCKVVFAYECVKNEPTPAPQPSNDCNTNPNAPGCKTTCSGCACTNSCSTTPYLTDLSVSTGTLSPAFNTKNVAYTVVVDGSVDQITINAVGSKGNAAGTITGTGTKNLSFGSQTFMVTISNNAASINYAVTVIRNTVKSKDNSLSSLVINNGEFTPAFDPGVNTYNVEVENDVKTMNVAATLNDEKASFAEGFGPREVELQEGSNPIQVRVISESGDTNIYTVNVNRKGVDKCTLESASKARLKKIILSSKDETVEMPVIDFNPDQLTYSGIELPYNAKTGFKVEFATEVEGDVAELQDFSLKENVERSVVIKVTSRECPNVTKEYTLLITLLDEQQLSSNALLESLYVTGHSELKFKKNVNNYEITLKKNENKVDVRFQPEESTTHCTSNHLDEKGKYVVFNKAGLITIKCVAQNNTTNETYTIKVNKQKGTSLFLIVLIVIIIVLLLIYLVLRLLGYKIYFNFAMIGAFFRGIGDGIRRLFDK